TRTPERWRAKSNLPDSSSTPLAATIAAPSRCEMEIATCATTAATQWDVHSFVNSAFFILHFALNHGLLEMDFGAGCPRATLHYSRNLIFFRSGRRHPWPTAPVFC